MILDSNAIDNRVVFEGDLCIVGAGVAGIVLANELKNNFDRILLLEAGSENFSIEGQDSFKSEYVPPFPDPTFSRLRMLGGSSNHWQNNTSPFSPIDFEYRDWIPHSGWPIGFSDIEPYYAKAGVYCGVGDNGYDPHFWMDKLNGKDLFASSTHVESRIYKIAGQSVRFFQAYGDQLARHSNITILKNCTVIDAVFDEKTQKISSLKAASSKGLHREIRAKVFVLCLGGIENTRLMLMLNEKYSNKLGNQYGSVGCYFMEHPTPRAAHMFPLDKEQFSMYHGTNIGDMKVSSFVSLADKTAMERRTTNIRIPFVGATNYEISDAISSFHILGDSISNGETPEYFGEHLANFASGIDDILEALSRKKFNKKVFDYQDEFGGFEMPMMIEQTPIRDSRILLTSDKDKFGLNRVKVDWKISQDDINHVWQSLEIFGKEVGGLSVGRLQILKERSSRVWGEMLGFSDHHMGTTRMAANPQQGVVDKHQLVFGTNNLFVNGSSVFATGSHVPPTLTISALTIRLADYLKKEFGHA